MQNPILKFAEFFRSKLRAVPELETLVGARIYNSSAPPKAVLPFAVFTVIPLDDNFGQARASIQTRLLCDFKIEYRLPLDAETLGTAIEAVTEIFRTARTAHSFGDFRISVWGRRPISQLSSGAASAEKIYSFGKTFQATMSRVTLSGAVDSILFYSVSGADLMIPLASDGGIPFLTRAGAEDNITLVDGKIPFTDRNDQQLLIPLV